MENLENQLAPEGQFPGTAETFATPVGSDKPVRLKMGHPDKRHLQLSKEAYRARSARQKELDAQTENEDPSHKPSPASPPKPAPKKRGRPKGSRNSPRVAPGAAKQDPLIGRPCPAPSTDQTPPVPIPTNAMLEQRMARLEQGMDLIVRALADRDARSDHAAADSIAHHYAGQGALAELDEELEDDLDEFDAEPEPEPEPGESHDAPPLRVAATRVDDSGPGSGAGDPVFERGLRDLQQTIVKRNPQKLFRQYWYQLARAAQYNEWPPERREAFNTIFDSTVAHPEFIYHMSKFLRGSRNGQCIGNEQIARVCGMMAGFLAVYKLAATGR